MRDSLDDEWDATDGEESIEVCSLRKEKKIPAFIYIYT